MKLGRKIKAAREAAGLSQRALAEAIHVSTRTVQYYEADTKQPKTAAVIIELAHALGVGTDYFLSPQEIDRIQEQDAFLAEAAEKYGNRGRAQAKLILAQTSALFAGGELDEVDQEAFFKTMTEIYFDAKKRAQKYTPQKRSRTKKADLE